MVWDITRRRSRTSAADTATGPTSPGPAGTGDGTTAELLDGPLGRRQVAILAILILLVALDGFDLMSMAFVAPVLTRLWRLGPSFAGLLLASGVSGMAIGALFLSPLADVIGRRAGVLVALALLLAGTVASALATGTSSLVAGRVVTGLGAGLMVAVATLLAAEFSGARSRGIAVAATTIGFPVGGISAAFVAGHILEEGRWQGVFLAGSALAVLLLAVVVAALPESPAYMAGRRDPAALGRLNAVLAELGRPAVGSLPPAPTAARRSYAALLTPELALPTLILAGAYALLCTANYYLLNWLPQMIVNAGSSPANASRVAGLTGLAGIAGGLALGALATPRRAAWLSGFAMLCFAVSLAAFGLAPARLAALGSCAAVASFFVAASNATFYVAIASAFPALVRGSVIGLVTGVGRLASAVGPYAAGQMFERGMSRTSVSLVFGLAAAAAGLTVLSVARAARRAG